MKFSFPSLFFVIILFTFSCKKAEKYQEKITGGWDRIVYDHDGREHWIFTEDNRVYVNLVLPEYGVLGETVAQGNYEIEITNYSHGNVLNKNMFKVANLTISNLGNLSLGQFNIDYRPNNTVWEIHRLDDNVLIIATELYYTRVPSGLISKEFYRN